MHDAVVQLTAFSSLNCAPGGTGADWMRHRAPPHRSTRTFEFEAPTAVQASAAGQATANRLLDGDPAGLGVGWIAQVLPFHRSASVRCAPDLTTNCPTPVHAEPDGHDTPLSALAAAPAGFGVGWTAQTPPLRRSASVTPRPDSRTCKPTAVHTDLVRQETALNKPFPARGFGVGVIDHPDPAVSGESARTPAVTGAPVATKITAAPVATAIRLIRPRIATPNHRRNTAGSAGDGR